MEITIKKTHLCLGHYPIRTPEIHILIAQNILLAQPSATGAESFFLVLSFAHPNPHPPTHPPTETGTPLPESGPIGDRIDHQIDHRIVTKIVTRIAPQIAARPN